MKVKDIEVTTRTIEQRGVTLPWVDVEPTGPIQLPNGEWAMTDRLPKGSQIARGEVFIPLDTLYELSEQDTWDSQFGSAFLLGVHEGLALEQAGLAVRETRGGYHRSDKLIKLIKRLEES